MQQQENPDHSTENRPGILMVGSSNVGKRTLLSRLLSVEFADGPEDDPSSSANVMVHGWTINTKYYTADVSLWMAHLHDGFDIGSMPTLDRLEALVMVFDVNELSSLTALQKWVSNNDIQNFEITLCIGNKVDLLPDHPVHAEYRRRLQKLGADNDDLFAELTECGISETEGSSLLGDEKPSSEIRNSCLEWCAMHNIEYIEACASSAEFDKCLSVNGDLQGIDRLFGAVSAHMWPGMILKSGDKITEPSLPENQASSEEESDYEFEYEVLSSGSVDPWGDTEEGWVSAADTSTSSNVSKPCAESSSTSDPQKDEQSMKMENISDKEVNGDAMGATKADEIESDELGKSFNFEDLEHMMSEIGNIRDSLRLMPDFQRREMAANMAMKMAGMFGDGDSSDGE